MINVIEFQELDDDKIKYQLVFNLCKNLNRYFEQKNTV